MVGLALQVQSHSLVHESSAEQTTKLLQDYAQLKQQYAALMGEMRMKVSGFAALSQLLPSYAIDYPYSYAYEDAISMSTC